MTEIKPIAYIETTKPSAQAREEFVKAHGMKPAVILRKDQRRCPQLAYSVDLYATGPMQDYKVNEEALRQIDDITSPYWASLADKKKISEGQLCACGGSVLGHWRYLNRARATKVASILIDAVGAAVVTAPASLPKPWDEQ